MRALFISLALFLSVDAFACPMADAAAYAAAAQEVKNAEGNKATFKVAGMHCGDCSTKVVTALKAVDGVQAAAVDYQTGEAVVAFDASKTNAELLLAAISGTGFAAEKVEKQG